MTPLGWHKETSKFMMFLLFWYYVNKLLCILISVLYVDCNIMHNKHFDHMVTLINISGFLYIFRLNSKWTDSVTYIWYI